MVRTDSGREGRERALTPLVGGVLIVGFVSLTALGVLVVGLEVMTGTQQAAETERTQSSLVELQHTMGTVAEQPENADSIDLDVGEGGAIIRDDTGSVSIAYANISEEFNETITFGAVEYEGKDGTQIAVEAGAVFRGTGASSRLVSGPSIRYDNDSNSLTFPIIEATGEEQLGSDHLVLHSDSVHSQSDVVQNDEVLIEIESKYWAGWEEYFVNEVGSRGVVASANGDGTGTVTVNLGRIDTPTPFENAVTANEEPSADGNSNITGETEVTTLDPIDDEIDDKVATAVGNYTDLGTVTNGSIDAGEYYADGVSLNDSIVVDLEDGDVTLVVDGDIDVTDEFRVENRGDNELRIYTTGDLFVGDEICVHDDACDGSFQDGSGGMDDPNPEHLHVYGSSSFQMEMSGSSYFQGVVYAPAGNNGSSSLVENGNFHIDGSIVLGTVDISGTSNVEHEESLKWIDPAVGDTVQPPELTYLNLVYQEIEVTSE